MPRTAQITPAIQSAMNDQIRREFASAYQYLAMAAWLETHRMPGAAAWMRVQAQEETAHGMRFFEFIVDRNGTVELEGIAKPERSWASVLAAVEAAYRNEQDVTASIMRLYDLAMQEKDHVSHAFLQSFLTEQIEEEKTASRLVEMFEMAADSGHALLVLDKELGQRGGAK